MASFYGIVLILCTITLLILAIRQHKIVSEDKPFDDSRRQIDFDDFYGKLRKFIGNKQEKIYAVLGIKNADNLLTNGIQEKGFCILTDKAAYFIGKVRQKKWIFTFQTNVQHRIIASDMKGINVGALSQIWWLLCAAFSVFVGIAELRWFIRYTIYLENGIELGLITIAVHTIMFFCLVINLSVMIYYVLHAFFLKRTNICIEFTSLTAAFLASELGEQEIKDFYKAVSEVQELNVNIVKPASAAHTISPARQNAGAYTNKITSISELSKLYENGMITKEEFEQLKQEVISSQ